MHVANCEDLLLSISCEMNADQSLFVVDLNERRSVFTIPCECIHLKKWDMNHLFHFIFNLL